MFFCFCCCFSTTFSYGFFVEFDELSNALASLTVISGLGLFLLLSIPLSHYTRRPLPPLLSPQIFLVSESYLFHAYAWLKYYIISSRHNQSLTLADKRMMASAVLLAALSIPLVDETMDEEGGINELAFDQEKEKAKRMAQLLGYQRTLSRRALLMQLESDGIVKMALPEVQALYELLEKSFAPLTLVKQSQKGLDFMAQHAKLSPYTKPLKELIVVKLLRQLSQVSGKKFK